MKPAVVPVQRVARTAVSPADGRVAAAAALLRRIARDHGPAVLASSFSIEDMVLADLIWGDDLPVEVVTLDTGRLPAETLALIGQVERHYGRKVTVMRPDPAAVAQYVTAHGADAF